MIKVAQIGCGKMSKYTMRYVYEHGAEIVAAVDINPNLIGKDIGVVIESEIKNVTIEHLDKLDELLKNTKPDIAIVTTMSLISDLHDVLRICTSNGVNVITTCEEAFYVENSNPTIYKEIDTLAKANRCTVTGCGYQDFSWGNLIAGIAGTTHKITKIKGSSSYNVEDYGIALAKAHGAGLTLEEFERDIASADNISQEERQEIINAGNFAPSYMWNVVGWLADKLNLTITSITQKCVPQTYTEDLESSTLGMTIKSGDATGMSAVVTAETEEGIIIEAECIGKVYAKDEFDSNVWTVYGEPDTTVTINRPATVELTCADIVNRIPDVINAEPGFIPTSKMGELTYRTKNLDEYLK
ncbi:MAG: Gfo/Idh/MocA family oxidoreductase [Bacilli bacterium]